MPRRAIVAAILLYGLLVQAMLAGFAPVHAAPAQDGRLVSILCGHAPADGSSDPVPADHAQACCLAACRSAAVASPVLPTAAAVAWPAREMQETAWRPSADAPGIRPASSPVQARGPPSV